MGHFTAIRCELIARTSNRIWMGGLVWELKPVMSRLKECPILTALGNIVLEASKTTYQGLATIRPRQIDPISVSIARLIMQGRTVLGLKAGIYGSVTSVNGAMDDDDEGNRAPKRTRLGI